MTRWLWYPAIVILGVMTIFAQLDRQARRSPQLASVLPDALHGFALQRRVSNSLAKGDGQQATLLAERLVAGQPMPAENLRMLAQAQMLSGERLAAAESVQLSASRGWRDGPTQMAMIELAIAAGDGAEAGRRLAALWATARETETLTPIAQPVLADPDARVSFARIVADADRWNRKFLRFAPDLLDHDTLQSVTSLIVAADGRLGCDRLQRLLDDGILAQEHLANCSGS